MVEPRPLEGVRLTLFDGRTLEYDFVPMFVNDTFRGHLSAYRDVTDQARAEEERERLLASEREENRRLAEMDAYRSEFLAVVSHELRTPLTSIVGYTELLRNMLDVEDSSEKVECLDAIVRNVDRLLRLAGDLVVLDSMESRTFPLNVPLVDVATTLRNAERTVAPAAAASVIEMVSEVATGRRSGPTATGSSSSSRTSCRTPSSSPLPRVASVCAPVPGLDGSRVDMNHPGIGIPVSEQALLFSRFFRASNARRRGLPGTGLGLDRPGHRRAARGNHLGGSAVGSGRTVTVHLGTARVDQRLPRVGVR